MTGKHRIIVQNNKLHYEFEIRRNITIIQGNSATGKTTLINMLRQAENLGTSSGIDIIADVPCRVLEGISWKLIFEHTEDTIFFIDEENSFINTEEFAAAVKKSSNYVVLITRENLYNLPYSVEEIYGLHSSGKYQNTKKVYQQMYQIYTELPDKKTEFTKILVEDSNSGYEFFKHISEVKHMSCESAGGKSNLLAALKNSREDAVCVIADGAAIGPEMNGLYQMAQQRKNIVLYLPESFEWLILKSGLLEEKEIYEIVKSPESYIDSQKYFSWERFFTNLLVEKTKNTYLQYAKKKLNTVYLHEKNVKAIFENIHIFDKQQ